VVSRSAAIGALIILVALLLIAVLSFTGYIPWTDFSPAIAALIVAMIPFGLGLIYKDRFTLGSKRKEMKMTITKNMTGEPSAGGPSFALIVEFFLAGIIALIGWYVVNLIVGLIPGKTPWTIVLVPYSIWVVGVFFLGLGILSVIIRLRR
jgi:hypothetical protein